MTTDAVDRDPNAGVDRLLDRSSPRRAVDVIAAIHDDAERIKRRELEEAIDKLEAHGGLTDGQRDAVEAMADAIVDELVAVPAGSLLEAAVADERDATDAAIRLFDSGTAPDGTRTDGANGTDAPEVTGDDD